MTPFDHLADLVSLAIMDRRKLRLALIRISEVVPGQGHEGVGEIARAALREADRCK